jgi:hypothetical protein
MVGLFLWFDFAFMRYPHFEVIVFVESYGLGSAV